MVLSLSTAASARNRDRLFEALSIACTRFSGSVMFTGTTL